MTCNVYDFLDKYPTASLQALGLLLLLHEPNATFSFSSREAFFLYFRLPSQYIAEKYLSELIDLGAIKRETVNKIQIYKVFQTKIKFEVPLTQEKPTINIDEQLKSIHKAFKGKVKLLFNECKSYIETQDEKFRPQDIQMFFSFFQDMSTKQYIEFFNAIEYKKIYALKYLAKIANSTKTKKPKTTYSENLAWGENKQISMENDFAIKVATGEAVSRTKYKLLLQQNDFNSLKQYYNTGKALLSPTQTLYTGYEWL